MTRDTRMTFGPPIPVVPIRDFSALPSGALDAAWRIVGPSAQRNMSRDAHGRCCELWQVIAAAYLEGLNHGAAMKDPQ